MESAQDDTIKFSMQWTPEGRNAKSRNSKQGQFKI